MAQHFFQMPVVLIRFWGPDQHPPKCFHYCSLTQIAEPQFLKKKKNSMQHIALFIIMNIIVFFIINLEHHTFNARGLQKYPADFVPNQMLICGVQENSEYMEGQ